MKRLDCYPHSNLEVSRLTCDGRESNLGLRGGRQALLKRAIQTTFEIAIWKLYSTKESSCPVVNYFRISVD
jgi:hypothetical protein